MMARTPQHARADLRPVRPRIAAIVAEVVDGFEGVLDFFAEFIEKHQRAHALRGSIVLAGIEILANQQQALLAGAAQLRVEAVEGDAVFRSAGVTELFYDLNWDPFIGSPDADPRAAAERAEEILTALAPNG